MRFCTFRRSDLCLSGRFSVLLLGLSHIGFLSLFKFLLSLYWLKFGQALFFQVILKLWPIIWFQLDLFLHKSSVFIYLVDWIHSPCNRSMFSPIKDPIVFLAFWKDTFILRFTSSIPFSFLSISQDFALAGWPCWQLEHLISFKQFSAMWSRSLSLHLCPLQAFMWCPYFWHLKHPQDCWDIHLNPLKTIVDLHLFGGMELIKCQDVAVGLDLFFAFSNGDSSDVCHSLFSQHYCYLLCYSQGQLLLMITPLDVFTVLCGYALYLAVWKIFILRMFSACLQLFTKTSKFPFLGYFHVLRSSC